VIKAIFIPSRKKALERDRFIIVVIGIARTSTNSLRREVRSGSSDDDLAGHDMTRATVWLMVISRNREKSLFGLADSSCLGKESVESKTERMVEILSSK
jgi:hypothetical protein